MFEIISCDYPRVLQQSSVLSCLNQNYDVTNITTEDHRVVMLRYTSEAAPVDEILHCIEVLVIAIHGAGDSHSVHLQLLDHCAEITQIQTQVEEVQVEVQVEMSIDRTDINECINLTAAAV